MENLEISNLLKKDSDELLILLAKELMPGNEFISNPKELIRLSNEWLTTQKTKISKIICSNIQVQKAKKNINNDSRVELVTVIADLISDLFINISPWTVSAIIVKNGLNWLCDE